VTPVVFVQVSEAVTVTFIAERLTSLFDIHSTSIFQVVMILDSTYAQL
jgi:hypothetical protein